MKFRTDPGLMTFTLRAPGHLAGFVHAASGTAYWIEDGLVTVNASDLADFLRRRFTVHLDQRPEAVASVSNGPA